MVSFCHKCGNRIESDDSQFCIKCGAKLYSATPKKEVLKSQRLSEEDIKTQSDIVRKETPQNRDTTKSYQSNGVLIIAFFLVLFLLIISWPLAFLVIILSAIAVYQDAKSIGAGGRTATETTDSLSWSPLSWGLTVLLLWIIGHPLYLIKRRGIFYLNNPETAPINQIESRDTPTVINTLPENKTIKEPPVIKSPDKTPVKTAQLASLIFLLIGTLLLIWVGISVLGFVGFDLFNVGYILHSNSDTLITQDLSSMALTISDLPSGWRSQGGSGTANTYSIEFVKPVVYSPGMVDLSITRYNTIDFAKNEYNSLKSKSPTYVKMETINIGNEGFGYIDYNDVRVIFRRGNIVVKIADIRSEYEYFPTINNAKNFAELVANRIK